ncbi:MAG: permease-like cell division protein FtsX [Elusimicrobia bacterium]|nr:permease-like cell division protein FtsX [Elusimicrobiota bacterium]
MKYIKKLSLLGIIFILVSLIFYGFFSLVLKNLFSYLTLLEERVEIVAFISDNVENDNQKDELLKKISDIETIEKIKYTSKAEAIEEFKKNQEFAKQIKILDENPLPATVDIYLTKKDPETIKRVAEEVKLIDGIEEIYYTSVEAENLLAINKVFRNLSRFGNLIFSLFIIISFVAVFLSTNKKEYIHGIYDGIVGGGIGFYILNIIYKHLFVPNFKAPVFFSRYEIILILIIVIVASLALRIPKNVFSKKQ